MASSATVAPTLDGRRASRFRAQRVQWEVSSIYSKGTSPRQCGKTAVAETGVGIRHSVDAAGKRSAGFSGLATCGSVWACAVCSHKVAMERAEEVATAIRRWEASSSTRYVSMVTLTMRHHLGQDLTHLWDSLTYAWSKATSGRGWKDLQNFGAVELLEGKGRRIPWVRFVEATHGDNGWHLHIHALMFLDEALEIPLADRDALPVAVRLQPQEQLIGRSMFARWSAALERKGLDAPIRHLGGLDVKRFDRGSEEVSEYVTKSTYDHAMKAAFEVASGSTKQGKRGGRAPFQLLVSVVDTGDADDLDLWHDWERGSRGRRQVGWARGFRVWLALEAERTDEEIAADELDGETLGWLDASEWASLRDHKAELLDAAEFLPLAFLRSAPITIWLTEYRHQRQRAAGSFT